MGTRGKRSAASLTVAAMPTIRAVEPRLPAPRGLTPSQAVAWRSAVDSLPAGWFQSEHLPLLVAYCRHCARADELAKAIATVTPLDPVYERLAKLAGQETRHIAALARAMRITHQSRLKAETAANRSGERRPVDVTAAVERLTRGSNAA